ncbi:MAG TPA: nucleotidyltransferase domain-containing protein [Clostridia bacterium]|nr:nucleotidyltransferase domain-containing protein [Clostridia bacterium]
MDKLDLIKYWTETSSKDYSTMMHLYESSQIEHIVKEYANLVMKELKVSEMYLYGSYVKGTFSADSDIDIAVVGENFIGDPVEDMLKLMRIRRKVDMRIEPHPFKSSDFELSNPYIQEILKTGIKIL